ncbi:hypothetical protein UFOVP1146_274 [uncultured Caudovirales phage]|uniref:Uncharacterized protein n=1 Tax=uncultured Caudovirales phage TaxID=2100421 RepID=A0A6J5R0H2_9CAUD|nr:hypothetical protein UFOVP812_187 [uncultured Caudovirales phage]CAB4165842.1 hypothetical protein UFOVP818_378 [uncultured Caudovirales phage]CAB4186928.1 hypothetical protein UFOVP1146_274 [uncultured Caudovirales phage]CAB4221380.1 hypothetical protein UFOVP1638_291 [uncultured Caudovirales phage]
MLVSNLFENNPQENGMAVLKQLATAVRDHTDIDLEVGNELLPIKYYQANHLISRWKALASSRQQNQALASFGDINWINDVLDAVDAKLAAGAKVGSVEGGRDVDEGWKSNLAGAALIGMGAMGSNAANARDLSHYNTDYLQAAAQGGKSMVSADDAKAELQQRAQGKQQAVSAPNPGTKASAGYSKEYLQSVIDGTHPRPMISKDRAQALLQQYQTNEGRTQMYSDGDRVKLNSTYANSDNPNEIYTVAQCDQDRKLCWIGDKSGSGWYVTFDQIIPARSGDSSLDETSTINGKREDPGARRWKQTSMSYEAAVNKYGADHVRKEPKNRAGQEVIAVHVPLGEQEVPAGSITKNAVDINQIASQMKFLPTTKLAKQYKFVKDGMPGQMPAMAYTVATQEQPVVTTTSDGKETQNTAAPNDVIMSGPSRENYVIKAAKFPKLYQGTVGGPVIPEQGPRLVALYTGKMPVTFTAPWDESMVLKPGDYLVKDGDTGYYRIAKLEYEQTYNKPGSSGQQAVSEGNNDEYNDESGMAYNSLRTIHRATKGLANTIKDGDNLPEWCQEKISLAEDYLVTVWDYLQSEKGVAEGLTQILRKFDPTIKARIRSKSQDQTNQGIDTIQHLADLDLTSDDMVSRAMKPNTYFRNAERYAKLANKDVAEGLGYSQDPAQAKWYHEGRMAFKGGTTGNLIQDIAKKHGCPPEWLKAFHAGYQDQEGFSKDGVAEGETTLTKTGRIHRSTDAYGGSPPEPDPIGDELDKSGTSRIDRALGVRFKTKGYQKDTNTVSEAPGDKGSSREHLAMLQAEREQRKQNQAATVTTADRNLKNYQAGRVRASDIKVAEGDDQETMNRHIAYYNKLGQTPEINMSKDERYKHSAAGTDYAEFLRKNNVAIPAVEVMSTWGAGFLNAFKYGWKAPSREIDQAAMLIKQSKQGMAEASKTRTPTTDFLRKHPVPDSEMVKPVKNQDANASFKNMMGGSSNELTKNLKIKEQESTPGDEHTRRQKLIKYLAKHKGWDHSDLEHATTPELIQYYKECRQGMAEGKDPTTDAAQEAYGFQRGDVKKNKDGSYVATNHAGSRKIFKSEKAAKAHADSGSQGMSEGSVNEVSVDTLSSYGKKAEKSAAKNADLSGQYQEKAFDKYNKGGAAADRSWADQEKAKEYAAIAARRNAGADLAAVKLGKKFSKGMSEARSVDDLKDELTSWKKEGPWKKATTKDPRGKAPNLSDRARRETEKMSKELNPTTKKV